jgi:hypothetical protein
VIKHLNLNLFLIMAYRPELKGALEPQLQNRSLVKKPPLDKHNA